MVFIGNAEGIDYIEISMELKDGTKSSTSEIRITGQASLESFIAETEKLEGKRILNGGGGNAKTNVLIKVYYKADYSGKKLTYCRIYGNQILLTEGGHIAYRMEDEVCEAYINTSRVLTESPGNAP